MKRKIVFASHDPGGCNLLVPIIDALSSNPNYTIFLLMAGPAKMKTMRFSDFGDRQIELTTFPLENFPNEYDVLPSEIEIILDEIKPDILFTSTSINSNIERYVIQYGKMSGVPTMSYIDSWIGEDIRFNSDKINVCPNYILVCDEQMKGPYLKFESENCKIVTVGNPHLEKLATEFQRETSIVQIEEDRILFFCENLKHYYPSEKFNEIAVLENILSNYNGKVILINFWGVTCGPCMFTIEKMEPLKKTELNNEKIVFVYLTTTDWSPIDEWFKKIYGEAARQVHVQ